MCGRPVSLNSPLVKVGPTWQSAHRPSPTKFRSPRSASAGYRRARSVSPAASASRNASNRVRGDSSVSIHAARALATCTRAASPAGAGSPNAARRRQASVVSSRSSAASFVSSAPISRGSASGRITNDHSESALPSQPSQAISRTSSSPGALRSSGCPSRPGLRGRPSAKAHSGRWQSMQARVPSADRRGSVNRRRPSSIAAGSPEARFPGSRSKRGGHGPWATIASTSSGDKPSAAPTSAAGDAGGEGGAIRHPASAAIPSAHSSAIPSRLSAHAQRRALPPGICRPRFTSP